MKRFFGFAVLLSFLSIPAFAASNSVSVTFDHALTVGTTQLPAGEYKVTWTGTAPNVQVTLEQKGARHPASATVPARLISAKNDRTQFTTSNQSGTARLEQLQLKDGDLQFTSAPAPGQ